jgi:hypothetical protein
MDSPGEYKMGNKPSKEISRRDAIKILAAVAGAATLVNLPDKWTKPGMEVGVLPAHAQTSVASIACGVDADISPASSLDTVTSSVTIIPARAGVQMHFNAVCSNVLNLDFPQSGDVATNALGVATVALTVGCIVAGETIQATWSFVNPADGIGNCLQTLTSLTTVPC